MPQVTEQPVSAQPVVIPQQVPGANPQEGYPSSVAAVIKNVKYKPEVLAAMREFKASFPWRGTLPERIEKFKKLHAALCGIYRVSPALIFSIGETEGIFSNGVYDRQANTITLMHKLSVVTYLHEFAHAVFGSSETKACVWSINLFRRVFPVSFAKSAANGHLLVRRPMITIRPPSSGRTEPDVSPTTADDND